MRCNFKSESLGLQHLTNLVELQAYHVGYLLLRELIEGDDFIDTVQKLRTHGHAQLFASGIARHDDDSVLEVCRSSLVVGQPSVVEYLQQDVEHIGVGFLYLVEQQNAVGFSSDGFGELAALVVADISRRCTDETAYGVLLLVFAHVDTCHHCFVVEEIFCQGFCQLSLSDTRRAEENKRGDGALGVLQTGTASAHGIADSCNGLVLTDDAVVEFFLEM